MTTQVTAKQPKRFSDFNSGPVESMAYEGQKIEPNQLFGIEIIVHAGVIGPSKIPGKEDTQCLTLQITIDGSKRIVFSGSKYLIKQFLQRGEDDFPFFTKIVRKENRSHQFT